MEESSAEIIAGRQLVEKFQNVCVERFMQTFEHENLEKG